MNQLKARHLEPFCRELLEHAPILVLQGARQVGKSTLARQLAGAAAKVVSLDDELQREFAKQSPAQFLRQAGEHTLVIDELQRVPELTLQLKAEVDLDRRPGRFIVTGSANLLRTRGSGDSLAGRQESVVLRPFSVGEQLENGVEDFISWLLAGDLKLHGAQDPMPFVLGGGFPIPLTRSSARVRNSWFTNYIDSLVTHDAAEIRSGEFAASLRQIVQYLAANPASELVKTKIAQQIGSSESTADTYLKLLAQMYLLEPVPAWGLNFGSRVVRRPKAGLLDTGMAAALTGFNENKAKDAVGREFYGQLLEQFVANELLKQSSWSENSYQVYHFRERSSEIDLVVELADGTLILIEVKSREVAGAKQGKHLYALKERLGSKVAAAVIFYTGQQAFSVEPWLHVMPVSALWNHPK